MDAKTWVLAAGCVFAGVCLAVIAGPVRDAVLDVVDAVACWWWDLIDTARRVLAWLGLMVLVGLALSAVVVLVLPRLAER